tara:strand:- start:6260 stop:7834 length:1575 start_codon:yes stop_codon:yes gene_type:complete
MKKSWDYIVIGAGHNGLCAASTLAKAGKSVLVVDQRSIIGGLSASHNYLPEAPKHLLSLGAMDDALMASSSIARDFNLYQHGYDPIPLEHPYGWMNEEGESLLLFSDFDRTVEEISYHSPKDAQTYRDVRSSIDFLMGALDKLGTRHPAALGRMNVAGMVLKAVTDKQMKKTLARMLSVSAFEMIAETFESEAMRGLWAYWSCMFAPATVAGGGVYLSGFGNVHRSGIFRPKGGMTGLVGAFAGYLKQQGGEIRLNSKVSQVIVEDNQAKGVRLESGEELYANCGVLANCAPQVVLGDLLADDVLDANMKQRVGFIPANSVDVAPFKIDIAAGKLGYPKAQARRDQRDGVDLRKTTFMTGTIEQHMVQHDACKRGEQVDFLPPMYFSILSGPDASIAPPDGDVLYIYANVPLNPIGGWAENKQTYSEQIMASVQPFIAGLDSEIGRVETCPQDFIDQFSAPNAAYFHVDMIPSRMGMNRPAPELGGYKTPVDGLYLASAGSHPSGGVCGQPGKLAAECALAASA